MAPVDSDVLTTVRKVKGLAAEVGGMSRLGELLAAIGD